MVPGEGRRNSLFLVKLCKIRAELGKFRFKYCRFGTSLGLRALSITNDCVFGTLHGLRPIICRLNQILALVQFLRCGFRGDRGDVQLGSRHDTLLHQRSGAFKLHFGCVVLCPLGSDMVVFIDHRR